MLETLLVRRKPSVVGEELDTNIINFGDATMGYYGVVPADQLITGDALASAIGLTAGSEKNTNGGWLKFAYNGKILYVAKQIFRIGLSWQSIYQAGAVYGDGTNGYNPSGAARLQNAQVTLSGNRKFRVRLLNASDTDPASGTVKMEVKDLFQKIMAARSGPWAQFDHLELGWAGTGTTSTVGAYNWTMQTYNVTAANRLVFHPATSTSYSQIAATNVGTNTGWRPVLEPI